MISEEPPAAADTSASDHSSSSVPPSLLPIHGRLPSTKPPPTAPLLPIPAQLHEYVDSKLRTWIKSAEAARDSPKDGEYIVISSGDVVVAAKQFKLNRKLNKVIPMNNQTGEEQLSSTFTGGRQQGYQLKHGSELTTESLKAVYIFGHTGSG